MRSDLYLRQSVGVGDLECLSKSIIAGHNGCATLREELAWWWSEGSIYYELRPHCHGRSGLMRSSLPARLSHAVPLPLPR